MLGSHTLTIELDDDEYRCLVTLAKESNGDLAECVRELVRERSQSQSPDGPRADARSWEQTLESFNRVRTEISPWAPGEFRRFLDDLRIERDSRA